MTLNSSTVSAGTDATATQYNNLRKDVVELGDYAVTTGSANAYVLTVDAQITAYATGQSFVFKTNFTNTGSVTLNVNSIGAKTIKDINGNTLQAGALASGTIIRCEYDGTDMIVTSTHRGATGNAWKITNPVDANAKNLFYNGAGSDITSVTATANRLYYIPFIPKENIILSEIGLYTGGTGGAPDFARIGIYSTVNDRPNTLLSSTGDLDITAVGYKSEANTTILIAGTKYFIGVAGSVNFSIQAYRTATSANTLGFVPSSGASVSHYYESLGGGWTTLPSTAGSLTNVTNTNTPAIFYM